MCGIAGLWMTDAQDGRVDNEAARAMVARATTRLAHRGPDDAGIVELLPRTDNSARVVFGHRRLSIIDLSAAGHQPMHDPETGNWIVYNGEVYNFAELRTELEAVGCRFRSHCDTELILQSYKVWGRECVKRWRGMFAAAIWDDARQELFLVRDRLGIKPLYYAQTKDGFAFASELRALLAMNFIERKINVAAVDTFLMFGAVQDPLTIIEGIYSLPAAHTLTVTTQQCELHEYWELPLDGSDQPQPTKQRAIERIGERLDEAIRLRLISDVPLGLFLSGGIDSSALAMMMRRSSPAQVKAFTISFSNAAFDEAAQAQRTSAQLGVEHNSILLTEAEMLASCAASVGALDQPSIDGVNTYYVSQAVKRAGITVALSGLGGDEAFCGYAHFRTVPRMESALKRLRSIPYSVRYVGAALLERRGRSDRNAKLRALLLDDYGFTHPYFLARTLFLPAQIAALLEPEAIRAIDYGAWAGRVRQLTTRAARLDPINRISYMELKTYIANTLLRDADVMSMAHSLEVRVPLLDHVLLEEVMRLPGAMKLDRRLKKPLLVRSLPEALPPHVTNGRKRGFTLPFADWLHGELRPVLEESFAQPPVALDGIINPEAVRAIWRAFQAGECSWTRPWALYVLYQTIDRLLGCSSDEQKLRHAPDVSFVSASPRPLQGRELSMPILK